jgi:hypothetical protein
MKRAHPVSIEKQRRMLMRHDQRQMALKIKSIIECIDGLQELMGRRGVTT